MIRARSMLARAPAPRSWVGACALLALASCSTPFRMPQAAVARAAMDVAFPSTIPRALGLQLHRGLVLVQGGRELSCRIEISVRADDLETAQTQADSMRVQLDTANTSRYGVSVSHPAGADLDAVSLCFRVTMPGNVDLRIDSDDADTVLRDYRGHAEIVTTAGRVQARMASGSCRIANAIGDVRVEGNYGFAQIETRSGQIETVLPRRPIAAVRVDIASDDGKVLVDVADSQGLELRYATMGGRVDLPSAMRVVWLDRGTTQEDRTQLYRATVGESSERAFVLVQTTTGDVEVRRLAEGGG